jgi:c-di-GMP-binding flagellar brake protein YcgR
VLIAAELLFILLLAIIILMVFRNEGFSVKNRLRRAKVKEYLGQNDRRQYPRFAQSLEVKYSVMKRQDSKNYNGKTMDISKGGVKLILDEKLSSGVLLALKIALPNPGHMVEVIGEVVWTEDASDINEESGKRFFYSGVKFSSIKDPSGKHLFDYVRLLAPGLESKGR